MSLRSFFNNLFQQIAKFFKGLLPELKQAVHKGVQIVEAIKDFDTTNPEVADILTAIIPGTWDDALKDKLRAALPKIVVELRLVDAAAGLTDPQEIMAAAVAFIQQLDGDYQSAALHDLSIITAQVAADGKLDWHDAVYLLQWYYEHKYKGKLPEDVEDDEEDK